MSIDLEALYIDLHRHPELSFQETRTAGVITRELAGLGLDFVEGLGKTGVATSITGTGPGEGPVVWLRADIDGLPVEELTGLPYASTARGVDPAGTDVPVMHACGHDMHVTAMLGALERLIATKDEWSGTGTVESWTTPVTREGAAEKIFVSVRTPSGSRALAVITDSSQAEASTREDLAGAAVTVKPDGTAGLE